MREIASLQSAVSFAQTADQAQALYAIRDIEAGGYRFKIREISPLALEKWQAEIAETNQDDIAVMTSLLCLVLYDGDNASVVPAEFVRALPVRLIKEWSDIALQISGFKDSLETQKKT